MSYTKSEGTMEINRAPLPPKSGLRFSLRHRESVERVHKNQGILIEIPRFIDTFPMSERKSETTFEC